MTVTRLLPLTASIEVSSRQVISGKLADLPAPPGTRIYLPDLGTEPLEDRVQAAKIVRSCGLAPVPHIAARRIPGRAALEDILSRFSVEAGVDDILLIAGGLSKPVGPFSSSLSLLESGCVEAANIRHLAVAGHPEGSPDFSEDVALEALRNKVAFGRDIGCEMRIVTQFGFDGAAFASWAAGLRERGIDAPVHIGIAGPAKMATLLKYAIACGVGNSLGFLRKRAGSLTALTAGHDPEVVAAPLEASGVPGIAQLHIYAFGGLPATADWLIRRKSWHRPPSRKSGDLL